MWPPITFGLMFTRILVKIISFGHYPKVKPPLLATPYARDMFG